MPKRNDTGYTEHHHARIDEFCVQILEDDRLLPEQKDLVIRIARFGSSTALSDAQTALANMLGDQ